MRTIATTVAAGVLISSALGAQLPPADIANPTYDVVSVKPNKSGDGRARIGRQPGGRWTMVNVPAAGLILTAYPSKVDELAGAPAWVTTERFDVDARATFEPTREQERVMLRALLADRFKLAARYESQDRPIYSLVVARSDGRLPSELRRLDIDCATFKRPAPGSAAASDVKDVPICGYRMSSSGTVLSLMSGGSSMQGLADSISSYAGRPVFDKTGLAGYYAYTLKYDGATTDGVSIFTALQEQLGLKLEPARGPLDVVVIDHIERPTEN